jgi:hypothetical protein
VPLYLINLDPERILSVMQIHFLEYGLCATVLDHKNYDDIASTRSNSVLLDISLGKKKQLSADLASRH